MVNQWPDLGQPPQRRVSLLQPTGSSSCIITATTEEETSPRFSRSLRLSLARFLVLVAVVVLLGLHTPALAASEEQEDQETAEEVEMPATSRDAEGPLSDESTDASITEGASPAAVEQPQRKAAGEEVPIKADKAMCAWMFDVLIAHFEHAPEPSPPSSIEDLNRLGVNTPAFVTWKKRRPGREGFGEEDVQLRGCIGSLEPIPILKLKEYSLISALNDSRFHPVKSSEIPDLTCHVSLLHTFEPAKNPYDWEVGRHGLIISFTARAGLGQRNYRATYLPEVAAETGMSKRETLVSLVRKAGYLHHSIDDAFLSRLSLTRYQSSQARLDYESYIKEFGRYGNRE